jgi:hypothetical protein
VSFALQVAARVSERQSRLRHSGDKWWCVLAVVGQLGRLWILTEIAQSLYPGGSYLLEVKIVWWTEKLITKVLMGATKSSWSKEDRQTTDQIHLRQKVTLIWVVKDE